LHELLVFLVSIQVLEGVEVADLVLVLGESIRGEGVVERIVGWEWEGNKGEGEGDWGDFAAEFGSGESLKMVSCAY
jgi:hypothetical protein